MCQYCSYTYHDGWTQLLQYDTIYQEAHASSATASESTHGFHESWDELKADLV